MCLLIFSHQPGGPLPLVLAANRDEFHQRATAPSCFWADDPDLLAGRDLVQGGTWMGITRDGRFAAITNYRDPDATGEAPRSRGELPLDYLRGSQSPEEYLADLDARDGDYAGYNLLLGSPGKLWYLSNSGPAEQRGPRQLPPGLYGLSNASLDTPWPKVQIGKEILESLLAANAIGHDSLATTVNNTELALPEELALQNLTADMDQLLSAQFISAGPYGTRACTTLWVTDDNRVEWLERSYDESGEETGRVHEAFAI